MYEYMCVYTYPQISKEKRKSKKKKKWAKLRNYTEEEMEKANKHEELQIKPTMRYCFVPIRPD